MDSLSQGRENTVRINGLNQDWLVYMCNIMIASEYRVSQLKTSVQVIQVIAVTMKYTHVLVELDQQLTLFG